MQFFCLLNIRVKHVATTIKRLKNARNDTKLNEYENMVFQFPTSMKRKSDMQATTL